MAIAKILKLPTINFGGGCRPVAALVFKISGRLRAAGVGGFDSHLSPFFSCDNPQHPECILSLSKGNVVYRRVLRVIAGVSS